MANLHQVIDNKGAFNRVVSTFRHFIKADNSTPFAPEPNRYHLYVSYACPWASRCLMVRALKGLDHVIGVSEVHYYLTNNGWHFEQGEFEDGLYGSKFLSEIYKKAEPEFSGRITVPVLWDKKLQTIVNNESSEIIRMLNSEFNAFAKNPSLDLCPADLLAQIDEINAFVYNNVNNGVYKCGFASKQEPYEEAFHSLFNALDKLEDLLSKQRYLVGNKFTEADVRLFTTLIRFDAVYVGHFKCNKKRIVDYPNLFAYTCDIYQMPSVKETVNLKTIKAHYYFSHRTINPHGVIPLGPELNFEVKHDRNKF